MKYTDYYASLELDKSASEQDVRRAFRRLAKDFHPDMHPGDRSAEQKFKEINEAYEVLSDRQKRARYDQLGANWNQYQDLNDAFDANRRERRKVEFDSEIFDLNFSDFFETFFGQQAGEFWEERGVPREQAEPEAQAKPAEEPVEAPPELQYTAEISLEEALNGTRRRIQVLEDEDLHTIEVKIPPGVKQGSKVRVGSQNFYLEILLRPHPIFTPDGNSLRCSLSLLDYEAMLGCVKTVPTLGGNVQMKIPPGAQAGQTFRIRGQGLPDLRQPEQRGDILASLEIKVSKNLSEEEKSLMERFRALREGRA